MIKVENVYVYGFEASIRGLRNPLNSWNKSDSIFYTVDTVAVEDRYKIGEFKLGENDLTLMKQLSKAGNDHAKFLRMINVTVDITAPLYWWKEFDTYKVGTVANSCSTMHKIHEKEFTLDDFSVDHLTRNSLKTLESTILALNYNRHVYINGFKGVPGDDSRDVAPKDKKYWWQMIQLLPSSYNQKRTVQLNYQVLKSMYHARKNHKLDEWREFCEWCESLPYFKEICIE